MPPSTDCSYGRAAGRHGTEMDPPITLSRVSARRDGDGSEKDHETDVGVREVLDCLYTTRATLKWLVGECM